jgi:hypothetical protein
MSMRAKDGGGRCVRTSERPCPRLRREQGDLKTFSNAKARPPAGHLLTARGAAITKLVAARLAGACTRSLALGEVGMTCFGTGGRKTPHFKKRNMGHPPGTLAKADCLFVRTGKILEQSYFF